MRSVIKPEYQTEYQSEGRACRAATRLFPCLIRGLILDRVPPSRLVLYIFFLFLHKF